MVKPHRGAGRRHIGRKPINDQAMDTVQVRLPKPMLQQIESRRKGRLDRPDRSTMIRELLAAALALDNEKVSA